MYFHADVDTSILGRSEHSRLETDRAEEKVMDGWQILRVL